MTKKAKVGAGIAGIVVGVALLAVALLVLNKPETKSASQGGIALGALIILVGCGILVSGQRGDDPETGEVKGDPVRFKRDSGTAVVDPGKTLGPIGLNQDFSVILINRANDRASKGNFEGAIDDYSGALKIKPDNPTIYRNRGSARLFNGDVAGAIADYSEAIRIKPDYADAYLNRGMALNNSGDRDGAAADLKKAVELDPTGAAGTKAKDALAGMQ